MLLLPRLSGRLPAMALAGMFVVSACSMLPAQADLAPTIEQVRELAAAVEQERVSSESPTVRRTSGGGGERSGAAAEPAMIRLRPRPRSGPFEMNLYRKGDFVHQATKDWCVAGSTATMMNIIDSRDPRRSARFQKRLYDRGRELSPQKDKLGPIGVDLTGWKDLLDTNGYGPYVVTGSPTLKGAIHRAAEALRLTNRPVGLVTWRGAHSWVMSGFKASADPAHTDDFVVQAVYIQDTWYPYVSTIWGASRPPDSLVPVRKLKEDYLPYQRPRARYPRRDGKYMLILPVLPEGTIAR